MVGKPETVNVPFLTFFAFSSKMTVHAAHSPAEKNYFETRYVEWY